MRDAKIVTFFKNKGDHSDCNNYHGISLLSIVGKAFARVVLARLQLLTDHIYPESQCGFRSGRSTVDIADNYKRNAEQQQLFTLPLAKPFIAFSISDAVGSESSSTMKGINLQSALPPVDVFFLQLARRPDFF